MATSETIWTVLPQGATGTKLHAVAIAGPRLRAGGAEGSLAEFEDWLRWPAVLGAASFSLMFANGVSAAARPTGRVPLEPALWERIFPPSMRVRSFGFKDHSKREIASFPVMEVRRFIEDAVREMAIVKPAEPARLVDLTPHKLAILNDVALPDRGGEIETSLDKALAAQRTRLASEMRPVALDLPTKMVPAANLLLAQRFLSREPPLSRPPEAPKFDFHQVVAALGDHPTLLRMLGIAIELECERAELPAEGTVAVAVDGLPGPLLCPATRYALGESGFFAVGADDALRDGMLRLEDARHFDVQQLDVDSGVSKLLRVARLSARVQREEQLPGDDTEFAEGKLPTLRSAGFSVVRHNRAELLGLSLLRSAAIEEDLPKEETQTVIGAEDLVRGYRLDVWDDETGKWHSLHRRAMDYIDLQGKPLAAVEDEEGYVKATTATSGDTRSDKAARLYLHETLFGWDGWSLSAPRPGLTISEPGGPDDRERPVRPEPEAGDGVTLHSRARVVPGTLPRLRYGRSYRFRARVADLAAGGLGLDDADEMHATGTEVYRRYDPVLPPVVIRRRLDTEGESLERLVIRSDFQVDSELYPRQEHVARALEGSEFEYLPTSERHVAAPKSSQLLAELHGMFDDAFGEDGKPGPAFWVATREGGSFLDVWSETERGFVRPRDVVLSTPGVKPPERPPGTPQGSPLETGQQFARSSEQIEMPYLPDPAAGGIVLSGVPGLRPDEPFVVEWQGKWPDVEPVRIVLREGDAAPRVEGATVVISLPAGEIAHVRYASLIDPDDLPLFGVWALLDTDAEDDDRAELLAAARSLAKSSEHQMVTPARQLALIHATQRPLAAPKITELAAVRAIGDTHTGLPGKITSHAKTTARLEVLAAWDEPVDIVTEPKPRTERQSALPIAFDIDRTDDEVELHPPEAVLPELDVVGKLSAGHFTDLIAKRLESDTPDSGVVKALDKALFATDANPVRAIESEPIAEIAAAGGLRQVLEDGPRRTLPAAAASVITALPDAARERLAAQIVRADRRLMGRHDFGDTRHRVVRYTPRATTRYREYFHEAISRDLEQITHTGEAFELSVPSSARPASPAIAQIMPSFTWETEVDRADEKVRHRHAGALRVYLERPWYSSGAGEQLAVLVGEADAKVEPYITLWGGDPVWGGPIPAAVPRGDHFPAATLTHAGLALAEAPDGPTVVAVPHAVEFDERRRQWRCDIRIDVRKSYTPFVRLALARYQPNSLDRAHLSPLVRTDFLPLLPDRTCRVELGEREAQVTVEGIAPPNILAADGREVRAVVEELRDDAPAGLGWRALGNPVVLQPEGRVEMRWTGTVPLREASGAGKRRLLVTEYEIFPADDDVAEIEPGDGEKAGRSSRVVYADEFEL